MQWADPAEEEDEAKSIGSAAATVAPEFQRSSNDVEIAAIESRDAYADIVGFADGFPAGSDAKQTWLTHCYGMVGIARGNEANSGNGSSRFSASFLPRRTQRAGKLARIRSCCCRRCSLKNPCS